MAIHIDKHVVAHLHWSWTSKTLVGPRALPVAVGVHPDERASDTFLSANGDGHILRNIAKYDILDVDVDKLLLRPSEARKGCGWGWLVEPKRILMPRWYVGGAEIE